MTEVFRIDPKPVRYRQQKRYVVQEMAPSGQWRTKSTAKTLMAAKAKLRLGRLGALYINPWRILDRRGE